MNILPAVADEMHCRGSFWRSKVTREMGMAIVAKKAAQVTSSFWANSDTGRVAQSKRNISCRRPTAATGVMGSIQGCNW
jgi:hypothetical protein